MRNLYLLLTCIFLVVVVYFFEEKKQVASIQESETRSELFSQADMGNVKSITGRRFKIESTPNGYKTSNGFDCSDDRIELFLSQFQSIKVLRILTDEEKLHIPKFSIKASVDFKFDNGQLKIEVGDKLEFNTSFYIRVTNLLKNSEKIAIAKYENTYNEKFNINGADDAYRSSAPYDQVLTFFGVDDDFFYNLNPFKDISIDSIHLKTFRSPKYEINLLFKHTKPEIYTGLTYNLQKFKSYSESLSKFMAKKVSIKSFDLKDEIGELKIVDNIFRVYKKYGAKVGYFIVYKDKVYEIGPEDFRNIFSPFQEFWNKKIDLAIYDEINVKDKADDSIMKYTLSENNYWGRLLLREAHNVRVVNQEVFKHKFEITTHNRTFLVGQSHGGIEVWDKKNNLIFQFLEKLQ